MQKRLLLLLACAALATYAAIVVHYVFGANFMDHLEPMVASSTWAFLKGRPIYHEATSGERFAVLYGPVLYLLTSIPLLLFGPSILTAKAGAAVATLTSLFLLYKAISELRFPREPRLLVLGWLTVAFLSFPMATYWNRGEPWMLLLVGLALWASLALPAVASATVCGLAAGLLSGLKLHGAIYALPALALLFERTRWRGILIASLSAWVAFAAPFLFWPSRISFSQMLFWIEMTSQHGVVFGDFLRNLGWAFFLALPAVTLLPALRLRMRPTTLFWTALAVTAALASFTGSLKGAGRHHLIPWLPSLLAGYALLVRDARSLKPGLLRLAPLCALISVVGLSVHAYRRTSDTLRELSRYPGREILAELEMIQARHAGQAIEMGYGLDYRMSYYRPMLVFKQGRYLFDGAALMDLQPRGLVVTARTLELVRSCDFPVWLFPKGEDPLNLHHLAPPNLPIFEPDFRAEFKRRYRLSEEYRFYSVWTCVS